MHDQAKDLRELVRQCAAAEPAAPDRPPRLAVVASGKGGAGTTTLAVNLAVAMARAKFRTVLVDADPDGGDVAILCGLQERYTLADVLSGGRTIPEVLQPGPSGLRVLPGVWGLGTLAAQPAVAGQHLLGQLKRLGTRTDLVVIDAGNSPNRMMQPCCRAAETILMVTTPETASIVDTYASIKTLADAERAGPIHALVNLSRTAEIAEGVQGRLAQACRRFLGIQLQSAGHIPADPQVVAAAAKAEPFVTAEPGSAAAQQVTRLAKMLAVSPADAETFKIHTNSGDSKTSEKARNRFNLGPPVVDRN